MRLSNIISSKPLKKHSNRNTLLPPGLPWETRKKWVWHNIILKWWWEEWEEEDTSQRHWAGSSQHAVFLHRQRNICCLRGLWLRRDESKADTMICVKPQFGRLVPRMPPPPTPPPPSPPLRSKHLDPLCEHHVFERADATSVCKGPECITSRQSAHAAAVSVWVSLTLVRFLILLELFEVVELRRLVTCFWKYTKKCHSREHWSNTANLAKQSLKWHKRSNGWWDTETPHHPRRSKTCLLTWFWYRDAVKGPVCNIWRF